MPSDDRALILAINADIRSLERQMRRAVQVVDGEGRQMERSAANTAWPDISDISRSAELPPSSTATRPNTAGSVTRSGGKVSALTPRPPP